MTYSDLRVLPDVRPSGDGAAAPFPRAPQGWAILCASAGLRPGAVRRAHLLGQPVAVFRTRDGRAAALGAFCPHMGAHLGGGRVTDAGLACPLHGWTFDAEGTCRVGAEGAAACVPRMAASFPVEERHGAVFAFHGRAATHPLPDVPDGLTAHVGRPVSIEAPWEVVSANGFDAQHLFTVHARALREPPAFGPGPAPGTFVLRYLARVTGTRLSDRVVKRATNDRVDVTTTAYGGTLFLTESRVGRRTNRLLVSIVPSPDGQRTVVTPVFLVEGTGPVARLGVRAAGWGFTAFLSPDVEALRGIRFRAPRPSPADEAFLAYLAYLRALPQYAE